MNKKTDYDVIIVGAGAAGGILARELSDDGLKVCLLERGPMFETKDVAMDELRFPIRQNLLWATPFTGGMTWRPHARTSTQKVFSRLTHRMDGWGPGGSMNHWGGSSWRFEQTIFKALDVWGQIPGGAIANWPISYEDLEPYYTKFEYRIGVSGDASQIVNCPPRSMPYPLPPIEQKFASKHFAEAARSLGYEPCPIPTGILSRPYQGRSATGYCGNCQSFECTVDAKSNTRVTELKHAMNNPNFTFLTDRYVFEIIMNHPDRVDGVICLDSERAAHEIRANLVIISANTYYNVWLLLLSKNRFAPGGIGNQHGQVGQYFQQHPRFGVNGRFDELMNAHIGPSESVMAITNYTENNFDHTGLGFIMGGYIYGARVTGTAGLPIEFATTVDRPEGVPAYGPIFEKFVARTFNHYYQVHAMMTDPPMQGSFIDLDPRFKNVFGFPLPRLTFSWSPQMRNMYDFFYPKTVEILRAGNAKQIWGGNDVQNPWDTTHPSGGTRMGEDPKQSVTDRFGKVHGIRNLYVSGNSLFPTMCAYNVTETVGALAYWQADHIKREVFRGDLI